MSATRGLKDDSSSAPRTAGWLIPATPVTQCPSLSTFTLTAAPEGAAVRPRQTSPAL